MSTTVREIQLEPLLDEKQLARITRQSLASIRRDRQFGRGVPFIRVGQKLVRYDPADVRAYLAGRKIGARA